LSEVCRKIGAAPTICVGFNAFSAPSVGAAAAVAAITEKQVRRSKTGTNGGRSILQFSSDWPPDWNIADPPLVGGLVPVALITISAVALAKPRDGRLSREGRLNDNAEWSQATSHWGNDFII